MQPRDLKARRSALGSQQKVADALGVQRHTVARWETAERRMPGRFLDLAFRCLEDHPSLMDPEREP